MAKILVIDDNKIVKDALSKILSGMGHEVEVVTDGINGLLIFKNYKPDLVILDRNIPGLTGSQVLKKIREADSGTPVVILTGYDDEEDRDKYLSMGATAFLSKGEGLSQVQSEVERLLAGR